VNRLKKLGAAFRSWSAIVALLLAVGMASVPRVSGQEGVGTRDASAATPATAPEAVLGARQDAFNSGDLEATLALFADDAVLISGTRRMTFQGKEEIRRQVQDQIARDQREFAYDRHVEGDHVVQTVRISRNDWRRLGIDSLEAVQEVILRDGLIAFLDTRITPASLAALELAQAAPGILWVTNRSTNNITALRAGTGEVIASVAVGSTPIGITAPQGTRKVYVSDEGSNQVSVISKDTMAVVATIPTGPLPHHIAASPDGSYVYVAEYGANKVSAIDTTTDTLVAEFTTGAPETRTHAVWVSSDGSTVFATNQVTNEIVALDALDGTVRWTVGVGRTPSEILVRPEGDIAFVSIRDEDKVQVVDLRARTILEEFAVGAMPDTLMLTPDGSLLLIGLRGTPAQLAVVELSGADAVSWVDFEGTTTGHNVLSPDGGYSFVAIEGDFPAVAVVDNLERTVTATYYLGAGRPHGVYYDPEPLR